MAVSGVLGAALLTALPGHVDAQAQSLSAIVEVEGPLCSGSLGNWAGGHSQDEAADEGGGFVSQVSRGYSDTPDINVGQPVLTFEDCASGMVAKVSSFWIGPGLDPDAEPGQPPKITMDELISMLRLMRQPVELKDVIALGSEHGFEARLLDWTASEPSCGCGTFYPDLVAERAP